MILTQIYQKKKIDYFILVKKTVKYSRYEIGDIIYEIKYKEMSFCVGKVELYLIKEYEKLYLENKDVK